VTKHIAPLQEGLKALQELLSDGGGLRLLGRGIEVTNTDERGMGTATLLLYRGHASGGSTDGCESQKGEKEG
jgi:hypothetical protein